MHRPARVVPSSEARFRMLGDEAVLLDLTSATYFGLNPVGSKFWQLIAADPSFENAHRLLLAEYEVEDAKLRSDLIALTERLREAGLASVEFDVSEDQSPSKVP